MNNKLSLPRAGRYALLLGTYFVLVAAACVALSCGGGKKEPITAPLTIPATLVNTPTLDPTPAPGTIEPNPTLAPSNVPPQISEFSPKGGSPGVPITITGANLAQANVEISGVEVPRTDILHNTNSHIVFRVPAGPPGVPVTVGPMSLSEYSSVASGPITVSTEAGLVTTAEEFIVTRLKVTGSLVTQGISPATAEEGYPLIKEKDTLAQFFVQSVGQQTADHLAMVGGANCEVLLPDGTVIGSVTGTAGAGGILRAPAGGVTNTTVNTSVNCLIPGDLLGETDGYRFRATLTSPPVEIGEQRWEGITVAVAEQVDTTRFFDTIVPTVVVVPIVPFEEGGVASDFDATRYWVQFQQSVDALKRIFPAKDINVVILPNYYSFPALLDEDGQLGLTGAGASRAFLFGILPAMQQLNGLLNEYNCLEWSVEDNVLTCSADNPNPAMFITGIIDVDLQKGMRPELRCLRAALSPRWCKKYWKSRSRSLDQSQRSSTT